MHPTAVVHSNNAALFQMIELQALSFHLKPHSCACNCRLLRLLTKDVYVTTGNTGSVVTDRLLRGRKLMNT